MPVAGRASIPRGPAVRLAAPPTSGPSIRILAPLAAAGCGVGVALAGPQACLVVVAGVLVAYATVSMPGVVLAAYFLIAFYKGVVQPYSPVELTILLAILNAVQIVPVILSGRWREASRRGVALWVAMTALIAAGVLYAPDQAMALGTAVNWLLLVFVPLLAGSLRVASDPRFIRQFLWVLFGTSAVAVVVGLALMTSSQRLVIPGTNTIGVGRAALLVPLLGVAFVLGEPRPAVRVATVVLIPAAAVVAVASGSRGPLIMLAILGIAAAIRYLMRPRGVRWRAVSLLAGLTVVTAIAVAQMAPSLPGKSLERFASFAEFAQEALAGRPGDAVSDVTSSERVLLFDLAGRMFESRPVLGMGTSGYAALGTRYVGRAEASAYPHNTLLQFAAEFGLVGVTLFCALVVVALTRRLPPGNHWRAVRALLAFFLLNALVSGDIYTDRQLWALLVLVLVVASGAARPSEPQPAPGPRHAWSQSAANRAPARSDLVRTP